MNKNEEQICEACKPDSKKLSLDAIRKFLSNNSGWKLSSDVEFNQIIKQYAFKDFAEAQDFALKVGELAELVGHHPSILLEYGLVTIRWWTHKIQGMHQQDLILASRTDEIYTKVPNAV